MLKSEFCFVTGPYSALRCVAKLGAPQPPRNSRPQHPVRLCMQHNDHLLHYIGTFRVSSRWCVFSVAVMESGEDMHSCIIRVCDTCDNAVLQKNREVSINMSDALHCVFWSL